MYLQAKARDEVRLVLGPLFSASQGADEPRYLHEALCAASLRVPSPRLHLVVEPGVPVSDGLVRSVGPLTSSLTFPARPASTARAPSVAVDTRAGAGAGSVVQHLAARFPYLLYLRLPGASSDDVATVAASCLHLRRLDVCGSPALKALPAQLCDLPGLTHLEYAVRTWCAPVWGLSCRGTYPGMSHRYDTDVVAMPPRWVANTVLGDIEGRTEAVVSFLRQCRDGTSPFNVVKVPQYAAEITACVGRNPACADVVGGLQLFMVGLAREGKVRRWAAGLQKLPLTCVPTRVCACLCVCCQLCAQYGLCSLVSWTLFAPGLRWQALDPGRLVVCLAATTLHAPMASILST